MYSKGQDFSGDLTPTSLQRSLSHSVLPPVIAPDRGQQLSWAGSLVMETRALPSRSYQFQNDAVNHRAGNSKRRALSGIPLWVVGRKEFFMLGSKKVNLNFAPKMHTEGREAKISKVEWGRDVCMCVGWGVLVGPWKMALRGKTLTPRDRKPCQLTLEFFLAVQWVFSLCLFSLKERRHGGGGTSTSYYSAFPPLW